jgi:hypothetical protein
MCVYRSKRALASRCPTMDINSDFTIVKERVQMRYNFAKELPEGCIILFSDCHLRLEVGERELINS